MQLDLRIYDGKDQFLQENESLYQSDPGAAIFRTLPHRLDALRVRYYAVFGGFLPLLSAIVRDGARMYLSHQIGHQTPEVLEFLTDSHIEGKIPFVQIHAEEALVKAFSAVFTKKTKTAFIPRIEISVMSADKINDTPASEGRMRRAEGRDAHQIACFMLDMRRETSSSAAGDYASRLKWVQKGLDKFYVWENDGNVVCCLKAIPAPACTVFTNIYTPPDERGKGYATSLTSGCAKTMLTIASPVCLLEADRFNSAALHVYRKIGFEPVSNSLEGFYLPR